MKIANRCFENVAKFGYLGTTIKDQIKRRFIEPLNCSGFFHHNML
jgi:hypothetical protein